VFCVNATSFAQQRELNRICVCGVRADCVVVLSSAVGTWFWIDPNPAELFPYSVMKLPCARCMCMMRIESNRTKITIITRAQTPVLWGPAGRRGVCNYVHLTHDCCQHTHRIPSRAIATHTYKCIKKGMLCTMRGLDLDKEHIHFL
jgi:hypothetical protein